MRYGTRTVGVIAAVCAIATIAIAFEVRNLPAPGDISSALSRHPSAYTLSLGHMLDLTLDSFAYLRLPLIVAGIAFLVGAFGNLCWSGVRAFLLTALMMVLFFHAARLALVVFDPFLSSRPIADKLRRLPPGKLILDHHYYTYSSVVFYTGLDPLLLNGKFNNLEYGAAAPGVPDVFLTDAQFTALWTGKERCYLVGSQKAVQRLRDLIGPANSRPSWRVAGNCWSRIALRFPGAVATLNLLARPLKAPAPMLSAGNSNLSAMDTTSSTPPATASRANSLRKALFALLRLAIGVGILVYLVQSGHVDLHSLARVFRDWPLTLLGMAVLLVDIVFMSIRVSLLFHAQRLSLSLWNAIQLTLIGFFFSTFLPGAAGGDLAKLYYATRENEGRRAEVATVLLFDRIIGLLSLVLLPFLFAPFFLDLLRTAPTLRRILWLDGILGLGMCAAMASGDVFSSIPSVILEPACPLARPANVIAYAC